MAGLLSGFVGGLGKGISEGSKAYYDQTIAEQRDDRNYQRQVARDEVLAGRQEARDETVHQRQVERDEATDQRQIAREERLSKRKLDEVREAAAITFEMQAKYGAEALKEISDVRAQLGPKATDAQVRSNLSHPEAIKAFDAQAKYIVDQNKAKSDLDVDKARATALYSSAANSRATGTKRGDSSKARGLLADYVSATDRGDADAAAKARDGYIRETGEDPRTTRKGNWKPNEVTDKFGRKTITGWTDPDTGEFRPNTGGGQTQTPAGRKVPAEPFDSSKWFNK